MAKRVGRQKPNAKQILLADEISLKDLFLLFWVRKKIVLYHIAFFVAIGVVGFMTEKPIYVSSSRLIAEGASSSGASDLSGFASVLGISKDKGGNSAGLDDPLFYSQIVTSEPFLLDLMEEELYFESDKEAMTIHDYLMKYGNEDLIDRILSPLKSLKSRFLKTFQKKEQRGKKEQIPNKVKEENPESKNLEKEQTTIVSITRNQELVIKKLWTKITIVNSGQFVTIETRLAEPKAAAYLNKLVTNKLKAFLVEYKTQKEQENLEYIERRTEIAKEKFENAQLILANFRDQNKGVVFESAKAKQQRLESEYNVFLGIYRDLAVQLERSRIALQEKTPAFSVFESPEVPNRAENAVPSLALFFVNISLGIFTGGVWIIVLLIREISKSE